MRESVGGVESYGTAALSYTFIHRSAWKVYSPQFGYRIMDDSELRDPDPSSEPQPRHVPRHNILGGRIKMRFFGCTTGGDGKSFGTEIRNRGHLAFIKIGTLKASRRLRKGSKTRVQGWQPCRRSATTSRTRRSGHCVCYATLTRRASPRLGNVT